MGTLIFIAVLGAAAWFFLSGSFNKNVRDAETFKDTDIEDIFIELKKKILITSVYESEKEYNRIYYRLREILGQILKRHEHFTLDVEAKGKRQRDAFVKVKHHDSNGLSYTEFGVPVDLNLNGFHSEELLYLCFFLYLGGAVKDMGEVDSDPELAVKILDYLIDEKKYLPASFFKGFMMKYGVKFYKKSNIAEARRLLEFAQKNGVGSASLELSQLSKYSVFSSTEIVNP